MIWNTEQSREKGEETSTDASGSLGAGDMAFTMQDREGCAGGGKGFLLQPDRSASLRTNNFQTLFQPTVMYTREFGGKVTENPATSPTLEAAMGCGGNNQPIVTYALEGNGQRPSHQGDGYAETDKSYTLNTTEVHGVCYKADGAEGGDTAFAIVGDHENRPTDMTSLVISMDRASFNQGENAKFDFAIETDGTTHTLVARGPGAVAYPDVYTASHGGFMVNPTKNITGALEQTDYKEPPLVAYPNLQPTTGSLMASGYDKLGTQEALNGMYVVGETKAVDLTNMTESETNGAIQASMEHNIHSNNVVRVRYIVRRLTPLECERLQGFPDGWTDIGDWVGTDGKTHKLSDSHRYKALGNSIALPSWKWVLKRMCGYYERPATLASLFDGIGGFPLIWEQINGKGTCLWASEIEEFPMAVTTRRFK